MTSSTNTGKCRAAAFGSAASVLALALAATLPTAAFAQENAEEKDAPADIVITGSRIAGQALTAPNPIAQVSAEEFTLSSSATVENLLNTLPQVVPGESAYTNNEGTAAATIDLRGLGIQRNLVLVNGRRYIFFDLRQVTDLNTVPTALVERVELITGGSSAVYGSDAVSGVVNFILKKDFSGLEATAQYDITGQGDAAKFNADLILGGNFDDNRGNATLYLNYYDRKPTFADARSRSQCFLEDTTVGGQPALACGGSAGIPNGRIAGIPTGAALTARPGVQQALANLGLTGIDANGFKFDDTGQNVSRFIVPGDRYNFNPDNYLQLPQKRRMIGGMANYKITDNIEAYVEGIFTNNIVKQEFAATPISGSYLIQTNSPFLTPGLQSLFRALDATEGAVQTTANGTPILGPDGLPIITPAATRNDGYTTVSIGRRIEEGGTRKSNFERNAYRIVTGLRGDIGSLSENFLTDLSWDTYYSYARTKNVRTSEGVILAAAFTQGVTTRFDAAGNLVCTNTANNCVPLNIFGPKISQAGINFITTRSTSSEEATMQVASGVITGKLFKLPAGPVGFAAGFEWRDVTAFSIPSQGGVGDVGVISGGGYSVKEFFGEVRVPIFSTLELNGAFRYSDYSLGNVNGVWTYGGGATWQALPELMLRAQYQRAVRAPNVAELFSAQSGVSEAATDPCALASAATNQVIRGLCVASGVSQSDVGNSGIQPSFQMRGLTGGNPDLEEETTDTFTVGAVLRPMSGLALTVDYYNIAIDDAISRLGGSINNVLDLCYNQVQDINSPYCQAIVRLPDGTIGTGTGVNGQPSGVSVLNANIGKIKTDGIDVSLSYRMDLGQMFGENAKLNFSTAGNWLRNFDVTSVAALPDRVNQCAGAFGLTCSEPKPEYKVTTRVTLDVGGFTGSVRWQYIGKVTDDRVTSGLRDPATLPVPNIKPENYFDLSLSYDLKVLKIFGGVINMFDNHQQLIGSSQEQLNTFPSTYDPLGRRFYMGATVKF
jgi:iron complex outermembrane receptor protein